MKPWAPLVLALAACTRPSPPATDAAPVAAEEEAAAPAPAALETRSPICAKPIAYRFGAHVIALAEEPAEGELSVGSVISRERRGGPPYFWVADAPDKSKSATFKVSGCSDVTVPITGLAPKLEVPEQGIWKSRRPWSRGFEDLYSAWIQTLFEAKNDEDLSVSALHEILRDEKRNLLFTAELDGPRGPRMKPDCADLPYFLRAYFAFKLGLPFGIAECTRGGATFAPSCKNILTNEDAPAKKREEPVAMFGAFLATTVADRAHSGSARAPFSDENADYYPVPLDAKDLRPGTVYADPYGHTLMIAKVVPQDAEHGGTLFAVDAQPDGTVARKRFWRGNFLYARDPLLGGPGFKRFRPVVNNERASDAEVQKLYGDLSREAETLDVDAFYDRMESVLSPRPRDPARALLDTLEQFEEQVRTRVRSVDNGRKWLEKSPPPAVMPEGAEIFETSGPWEDFSTPSRDLRLLIAMDVIRGFPARVKLHPERFAMPAGKSADQVSGDLEQKLASELAARSITYTRSDGSPFTLTLADVLARAAALEQAFNPNDCAEIRWGAAAKSAEASTCKARAPEDQRARMEEARVWFRQRRRPPRK